MKTFLEESVSEIIANHPDLEDLVIVLPSRRAGVFFKEALVNQLSNPILSPKIFSIKEFIQEISSLKLVASTAALVEFYEIYFSNTPKEFIDSFEEFIQWAPPLLKDFSDLDAYLVDVTSAFENLSSYYALETLLEDDSTYKKKQHFWNSLTKYFECHKHSLYFKGLGTLGMLYREAVDSVEIYLQNINKTHYFIGFNALNTAESNLLQAFLEAEMAIVLWDIDQYFYSDLQHAAGRFIQRHHKEWTYYRQKGKMKFPSNFEKPKDIKIVGIPKNIGQAKYAASIIKNNS
ncbi:MAG: ATP-dependent helicase/nuclease subunit B, partial [Candidatus Arcticimaribacter sp.]